MSKKTRIMTLGQLARGPATIPTAVAWLLADLAEARGKQELFTRQSPQKLKVLRENALIESAVSSNRIEGVTVKQARVGTLVFGKPAPRDRNEEELQGYRSALKEIHKDAAAIAVSEPSILHLHELCRGQIWDAGQYKAKDVDIIETYPDGRSRVRFKTVPAVDTPAAMARLVELWADAIKERSVHPLIALAGFNLDFLCIHPFRDGNGRVSRLLLLLQCYHLGFEVGRYISLERIVEENKDRYYETLEQCSQGWHEGKHDPWPFIGHLLFVLREAYRELERCVGQVKSPRGTKTCPRRRCDRGNDGAIYAGRPRASMPGCQSRHDSSGNAQTAKRGTSRMSRTRSGGRLAKTCRRHKEGEASQEEVVPSKEGNKGGNVSSLAIRSAAAWPLLAQTLR